jgi:hypothetical protein
MALGAWVFNRRDRSIVHLSRRFLARWRDGGCARVAVWSVRFCPNHYLGCAHCPKNGQPLRAKIGGIAQQNGYLDGFVNDTITRKSRNGSRRPSQLFSGSTATTDLDRSPRAA